MPLPAGVIPWIVGGLAREAGRRYGARIVGAAGAGGAGYIASRFRKRKQVTRKSKQSTVTMMPSNVPPPTVERPSKRIRDGDVVEDGGPKLILDRGQGYTQLAHTKLEYGKVMSKEAKKSKILGSKIQSIIERWQKVNPTANIAGTYALDYYNNGDTDSFVPVYMMDLTCVPNGYRYQDDTTAVLYPYPMRRLRQAQGTGSFYTQAVPARDADNTRDIYWWATERSPDPIGTQLIRDKCMIEWIDIRLLLYGASKRPSACMVELWQFDQEQLVPSCEVTNDPNPPGALVSQLIEQEPQAPTGAGTEYLSTTYNEWQNMWINLTDHMIGNPISKRGKKPAEKPYKVLYSRRFEFQPIDLQEGDQTGHQQEVKFMYHMNKICSYDRNPRTNQIAPAELDDGNEWDTELAYKTSPFTVPKGRVFLVVRGETMQNTFGASGGAPAVGASFDIIVRRKRSALV